MHLTDALHRLRHLRTASGADKYSAAARHRAPHKPLLLLSVLDLIEQGEITTGFVAPSLELTETFVSYWDLVMGADRAPRLALPFFHLRTDAIWALIPQPGYETALQAIRQITGAAQLRQVISGAQLDAGLFQLMLDAAARDALRQTLIETYFAAALHGPLREQSRRNQAVVAYSTALLKRRPPIELAPELAAAARDPGFRRAVVKAYDHRCACCGIRLLTLDGRTAAQAAHIRPWSISRDDDPRNGLCLCALCHWAFDVGLLGVTPKYLVQTSPQLSAFGNISGHLATLHQRPLFEPQAHVYAPDPEALRWHLTEIFLRG